MKRNGCKITITMESYTDVDKIKRALIPFSKFQQEWIPVNADNPITVILTTDNIYETQPRNELYGMTYSFSVVFDLLVSALNLQNGVIDMTMDYLTILGNPGHYSFEFSRKPVPKGEKPSKDWLRKEEEARRQMATAQPEEPRRTESPKEFCRIQPPDDTRIEIMLTIVDAAIVPSITESVRAVIPSMRPDGDFIQRPGRLLRFSSPDLGLVARTNGAKSWSHMHYRSASLLHNKRSVA